jgi:hypothetical protein
MQALAAAAADAVQGGVRGAALAAARAARRRPFLFPPEETLPVAGLDVLTAQGIHYTLSGLEGVRGRAALGPLGGRHAARHGRGPLPAGSRRRAFGARGLTAAALSPAGRAGGGGMAARAAAVAGRV